MALANGDVIETALYASKGTKQVANIRYWRVDNVVGAPAVTDLEPMFWVNTQLTHRRVIGTTAKSDGYNATVLTGADVGATNLVNIQANGLLTGTMLLPHQCCGLISFHAETAPSRSVSRLYSPFPTMLMNLSDGTPHGLYLSRLLDLAGLCTNFQAVGGAGNTMTIHPVIYRRSDGAYWDITSFKVHTVWATQRRRSTFWRRTHQ